MTAPLRVPPLMILVAGPYLSGTGNAPARIAANVAAMTQAALDLFRAGHLPVMGEWYALPLCLRIGGVSAGADEMVALARQHGKAVYSGLAEVAKGDTADARQLMARVTGNDKHGNERQAAEHPRNRRREP